MELGPLARFLVAYAAGKQPAKGLVDSVLAQIKQPATVLFSTLAELPHGPWRRSLWPTS